MKAEFFNSGEEYVATLFDIIRSQLIGGFRPKRAWTLAVALPGW